jgi:predicted nucleic acid-binding protein
VSTQPEALRLADKLTGFHVDSWVLVDAAAELRRLHAVNAELLEALKALTVAVTFADPPKEFNGALCHEARVPVGFVDAARAAIAKAEEVKP